jgi:RNA polymerase nonessential primary-like sigma factor
MPTRFVLSGDHPLDGSHGRDLLRSYMRDISRVPLLSADQEITLGRQVQQLVGLEAVREELTLRAGGIAPNEQQLAVAANLELVELQCRIRQGQQAKERMVSANLRLVVSIAKNYTNSSFELADLIQEGTIGLVRGVEKFDPSRGYKFSTYAYWWIREGITQAIKNKSRTIRLPAPINAALSKLKRCQRELTQIHGRPPRLHELASASGLSELDVQELMFRAVQPLSFDHTTADGEPINLLDKVACDGIQPEQLALENCLKSNIRKLLDQLPEQEAQLLRMRYGIDQLAALSLSAVARELGISRDSARGLERRAVASMRDLSGHVSDYLSA